MSAVVARPLRGLVVVAVSDHEDLLNLLVTLLAACGAIVHGYTSALRAIREVDRPLRAPNVVVLDSATKDMTPELLFAFDDKRLPVVAVTWREPHGPRGVWWVEQLRTPHVPSTDLDVVCDTIQTAIFSR
jgi:hypothetical protein